MGVPTKTAGRVVTLTDSPLPRFAVASEVAELLGYSITTVEQYARAGKLPAVKVGARWFFDLTRLGAIMRGELQWPA